jgi:hypothetical protein
LVSSAASWFYFGIITNLFFFKFPLKMWIFFKFLPSTATFHQNAAKRPFWVVQYTKPWARFKNEQRAKKTSATLSKNITARWGIIFGIFLWPSSFVSRNYLLLLIIQKFMIIIMLSKHCFEIQLWYRASTL